MKKLLLSLLLTYACVYTATAQTDFRKGWDGSVKGSGRFYLGISDVVPASKTKNGAGLSNSLGINGDVFVPLAFFRKGWDGTVKGGSFGFNIGGSFNKPGDAGTPTQQPFAITGQTSAGTVAYKNLDGKQSAFRLGAGPEVNFHFGKKINAGLLVRGEYFSMNQNAVSATQTTAYNGTTKNFEIWVKPTTKTSGFAIAPELRLNYMFTSCIGVYAQAGYVAGPTTKISASTLVPSGNPQMPGNFYNIDQLSAGTLQKSDPVKTAYSATTFGGGLVIAFGKRKGWDGSVKGKMTKADSGRETGSQTISDEQNPVSTALVTSNSGKFSEAVSISIKNSGTITSDGIPIVRGTIVSGTVTGLPTGSVIKIEQPSTGDKAETTTDANGNFSLQLQHDTTHIISINGEEYGKIKIEVRQKKNEKEHNDKNECCKDSRWGEPHIEGIEKVVCGSNIAQAINCGSTKTVSFSFTCNSSSVKQCPAKLDYFVKDASGNIISSVLNINTGAATTIVIPSVEGAYCLIVYAKCNDKICDSCSICFKVACPPPPKEDCCLGSYWKSKSITWPGIKTKIDLNETATSSESSAAKRMSVPIGTIPSTQIPTSITINKCDSTYNLKQSGTYTFNASFACAANQTCVQKLFVKIKGVGNSFYDGTFAMPKTITFNNHGNYTISYLAVCGTDTCGRCQFTVQVDQNCCLGSHWNKAEYQTVNKNYGGTWNWGDSALHPLPLTISAIPTYKADVAINVENLDFSCAAGCPSGFIIKRKNLITGAMVQPDEVLPAGQTGASIYTKPFPQLITITPTCNGVNCGNPIIFKVECLTQNCVGPTLPPCNNCDTSTNLVFNGDFNLGNTGFSSGLTYNNGGSYPTEYRVTQYYFAFENPADKSIRVAASTINKNTTFGGKLIWKNAVPIPAVTGQKYALCFKYRNIWTQSSTYVNALAHPGYPSIECEVYINGILVMPSVQVGAGGAVLNSHTETSPFTTVFNNTNWFTFNYTWLANMPTAVIEFKFKNKTYPNVSGWQIAIDDIIFKRCMDGTVVGN